MLIERDSRFQIRWQEFPDVVQLNDELRREQSLIAPTEGEPPPPYHFTLLLSKYLYTKLHPEIEVPSQGPKMNPKSYDDACLTGLRALAYFSWDGRSFLARRVYPTYFDFLTYSQVPDGWGALGLMLSELRGNRLNRHFRLLEEVRKVPILLPYLREADRLSYDSVVIVPVCTELETQKLRGAIGMYIRDASFLGGIETIDDRFAYLSKELARRVEQHENLIRSGPARQKSPSWDLDLKQGEGCHGVVRLQSAPGFSSPIGHDPIMGRIKEALVSALNNQECFAVASPTEQPQGYTVYFSGRDPLNRERLTEIVRHAIGVASENCGCMVQWEVLFPRCQDNSARGDG